MSAALDYLEADAIDRLAARLEREGYAVQRDYAIGPQRLNLVANRGGERIAYEVKARPHLLEALVQLRRLREATERDGFTDFRLVVVSPPRETSVSVEGLDRLLLDELRAHLSEPLRRLAPDAKVEWVGNLEIDTVAVTREGIDLGGIGVVEATLEPGDEHERDGGADDFPLRFRILLDHDLRLRRVDRLEVDVSGLDGEDTPTA